MANVLKEIIEYRLKELSGVTNIGRFPDVVLPPQSIVAQWAESHPLNETEKLAILLAMIPHIRPSFLDETITGSVPDGNYPQFGGVRGKGHRGIMPTGETVVFLLGGNNVERRIEVAKELRQSKLFTTWGILDWHLTQSNEPLMSAVLLLREEYIDKWIYGITYQPQTGSGFPATLLETALEWNDLVLEQKTLEKVERIETWLHYNNELLEHYGMSKRIKPGFRALFYGAPGTGKSLTAALLGKRVDQPVYRVDLSMVISKYIGETEKNLAKLFDKAIGQKWILFFDEADALFSQRTNVKDANSRHANQEVAFLLQRIEAYGGLVILASNLKRNIDDAFSRRFQLAINFKVPEPEERKRLWMSNLPSDFVVEQSIDFDELAEKYKLTGANIVNIIHYAALESLKKIEATNDNQPTLWLEDILEGIRDEYQKEERVL